MIFRRFSVHSPLAVTKNLPVTFLKCFSKFSGSGLLVVSCDLGLGSPEWLQSNANFNSFNAFGEIDELLAGLPHFEATPPPLTSSGCFATTTTGEHQ